MGCFVSTSLTEGFLIFIIEAQSTGVKVLLLDYIDKGIDLTNNVYRLPIQDNSNIRSDKIINTRYIQRDINQNSLIKDYDASTNIAKTDNIIKQHVL